MASNTLFLDLVAIKGNSYHQKFVGMVGLNSYSHSASQNLTDDPTNATRTSGKANAFNFNFTKDTCSATSELFQFCLLATVIPKVTLHVGTNTGTAGVWMPTIVYVLENVLVASVSTAGSGGLPVDSFSLNFTKITCTYTKQDKDGSAKGNVDYVFDKASTKTQ
jgi:type VI secretion system secreted protein Hcp